MLIKEMSIKERTIIEIIYHLLLVLNRIEMDILKALPSLIKISTTVSYSSRAVSRVIDSFLDGPESH